MRFPGGGVVLAYPAFGETELVEPADHLQVPLMAVLQRPLRWMRRHREISELHRFLLSYWGEVDYHRPGGARGHERMATVAPACCVRVKEFGDGEVSTGGLRVL